MKKYTVTFGEPSDQDHIKITMEAESIQQLINCLKETWETGSISSIVLAQ